MTVTFDPRQYKISTRAQWEDAAAGAGGQSLAAARRFGPTGQVLATDISPAILAYPEKAASDAGQMLAGLPASDRDDAWAEIGRALAEFEGPDGFVGPCEMLIISATR